MWAELCLKLDSPCCAVEHPIATNRWSINTVFFKIHPRSMNDRANQLHSMTITYLCTVEWEQDMWRQKVRSPTFFCWWRRRCRSNSTDRSFRLIIRTWTGRVRWFQNNDLIKSGILLFFPDLLILTFFACIFCFFISNKSAPTIDPCRPFSRCFCKNCLFSSFSIVVRASWWATSNRSLKQSVKVSSLAIWVSVLLDLFFFSPSHWLTSHQSSSSFVAWSMRRVGIRAFFQNIWISLIVDMAASCFVIDIFTRCR